VSFAVAFFTSAGRSSTVTPTTAKPRAACFSCSACSSGSAAMHGGQNVPQKSSRTTRPRKSASDTARPSSVFSVNAGAGFPSSVTRNACGSFRNSTLHFTLQNAYSFPFHVARALTGSKPEPSRGPQTAQMAWSSAPKAVSATRKRTSTVMVSRIVSRKPLRARDISLALPNFLQTSSHKTPVERDACHGHLRA
jgi:hypothetical protein